MTATLLLWLVLAAGPNPLHPEFVVRTPEGTVARTATEISAELTCGGCHDAGEISRHSHPGHSAQANCIQCHVEGGALDLTRLSADGILPREALKIGPPRAANCAACHGLIVDGAAPVVLPASFDGAGSLTQREGAIVSPQRVSDSFLNLEGKATLSGPWDVHAAKLVDCVACHYSPNDPRRGDARRSPVHHVIRDPRRLTTAEFLHVPDHRLARADCRSCHDPREAHAFLPYRERHLEVIACQTCHVSGRAPAAELIDATVVTAAGTPVVRYRNVEGGDDEPLNAAAIRPLRPLHLMHPGDDGVRRLTPVNVVSRWRWVSGPGRREVPFETVIRAWRVGADAAPELLPRFDADGDGKLSPLELRLDRPDKVNALAARLRALGVSEPVIDGELTTHVLTHGVSSKELALSDCSVCHAGDSRLDEDYLLASYLPGGVTPRPPPGGGRVTLEGTIAPLATGGLGYRGGREDTARLHVLGLTRQAWTNQLGFLLFVAVLVGVSLHAAIRVVMRRRQPASAPVAAQRREYVFGRYERLWHWTMAASGLVLMATGVVVHNAGWVRPGGLTLAIGVHNVAAFVLLVNAGLALFYHLTTRAIRQFIPEPHGLLGRILEHVAYQSRGIFEGDPHPHEAGHKLNPLQQLTYLALLNVLFPLQIVTGVAIWAVGRWPAAAGAIGGLHVVAPLHNLGSWLFLTFFTLHLYLVTTGPTVAAHLRSMVTGYRSAPAESPPQEA